MEYLYNSDQQNVLNKLNHNEVLTLMDINIIINDVNNYKMSQNPGIDIDSKTYCIDRQLLNDYISNKYSDSIYFMDTVNNIHKFYI